MSSSTILAYATHAALDTQPAGTYGEVVNDSNTLLNGYYLSAGGGSWTQLTSFQQAGTGSVGQVLQAKARESVSVIDFGAQGGSHNDTSAFQAAVTALDSLGGGELLIPYNPNGYTIDDGAIVLDKTVLHAITVKVQGHTIINHIGSGGGNAIKINAVTSGGATSPTAPKHRVTGGLFQAQTPGNGCCIWIEDCGSHVVDNVRAYDFGVAFNIYNNGANNFSEHNTFIACHTRGGNYGWKLTMNAGAGKSMATTTWIACSATAAGIGTAAGTWTGLYVGTGVSIYRSQAKSLTLFPDLTNAVGFYCDAETQSADLRINIEDNAGASGSTGVEIGPNAQYSANARIGGDLRGVATNFNLTTNTHIFNWQYWNIANGVATVMSTSANIATHLDRIVDTSSNVMRETLRTVNGPWQVCYDNLVQFQDTSGNPQKVSYQGGALTVASGNPNVSALGQHAIVSLNYGGATNVTNITNGFTGQIITVLSVAGPPTIKNNANIVTKTGADVLMAANATMQLQFDGTVWRQIA